MNIVLIGYRGTGKSVVGALVAEKLGRECLSMDAEIVRHAGMSIPEIVEREGWPGFRDREARVAGELAARENVFKGRQALADGLLPQAEEFFQKGLEAWGQVLAREECKRLFEDRETIDDLTEVIGSYVALLS